MVSPPGPIIKVPRAGFSRIEVNAPTCPCNQEHQQDEGRKPQQPAHAFGQIGHETDPDPFVETLRRDISVAAAEMLVRGFRISHPGGNKKGRAWTRPWS